jgi:phospholipid/cholesterol/gamma-HCH transport system substrate-binding protein
MTTTKQQKIRIGMFALAAGALFVLVLVVFAGLHFWKDRARYEIVFDHTVYGLERGAEVYLNGIRVGAVDKIEVLRDDIRKVRVMIEIDSKTPVRSDTTAVLQFAGITGLKVIDLRVGAPDAPKLAEGGRIPEGETMLDRLEHQAQTMLDQSTELMARANQIAGNAQKVVENLDKLTDPSQLGSLVDQTKATAANLAQASAALKGLVDDNRAGLKSSLASIELAAKRTAELVDNGQLKSAVADLRQASRSFKELARDVRQKPSRLLFSNPAPDRKLP